MCAGQGIFAADLAKLEATQFRADDLILTPILYQTHISQLIRPTRMRRGGASEQDGE
ncbi:hypothetical protein [uncultured Tateyamaria sp.]|uniref:hypothetical protein n=1 Tax=uncultured Tateyamaria sp. TaxID=455651 RepID=UPI002611372D|nr:hypothetical protein [uncultured Tateyamaria sp.]